MSRRARDAHQLPLALVGCDFRIASSAWRSALPLTPEERRELCDNLRRSGAGEGLVAIDTCNRTEWLADAPDPEWAAEILRAWMLRRLRRSARPGAPPPDPYVHLGSDAARHLVRVAVGLESLVPGEREIAGQCNRAFMKARAEGTISQNLNVVGQGASRTVRRVERLCRFRDAARGVHALAAEYLAERLADRGTLIVGIAGMGEIGRKVAGAVSSAGHRVFAYNRTVPPDNPSGWRPLDSLVRDSPCLDALVVSTAATAPVLRASALETVPRDRPLLVLDLGIPAQVDVEGAGGRVLTAWIDDLVDREASALDEGARATADEAVALGVEEIGLGWRRHRAARLLAAAHEDRERLTWQELPSLLDLHLADLPEQRRRKLEAAIRGLIREQHERFVKEVEGPAETPR